MIPQHLWSMHAGQTKNWVDSDTRESWVQNQSETKKQDFLQQHGFSETSITYKFNSHGFRTEEFDESVLALAFGCSFTGGVGLPVNEIWPTLLGQKLGIKVWNLGVGGISMDTCYRLVKHYVPQLKPTWVFLLRPDAARFELHTDERILYINPASQWHKGSELVKTWIATDMNASINLNKNTDAIQHLCLSEGSKVFFCDAKNILRPVKNTPWPAARDLIHPGYANHCALADKFYRMCNEHR